MNVKLAGLVGAAAIAVVGVGCSTTNHDAGNPTNDLVPGHAWVRVETPPGQATLFMTCIGRDLVIMDPDGNTNESANDPLCGLGVAWTWQHRHGSDPAVVVGTGSGTLYGSPASLPTINGRP